ncbi:MULTISPECIES: 3-deoxy-manno-octulosonate cytidylyltransferase [Flammeovirga]|uniref:3-deoxy-manno-octulosonate cytidylyltransferase n=1 Tax=Flammeovirga agarivorans TaxID=2726742 RepID=A0A7X8SH19_9BACT|nr:MULTISPECIES: 3-deoxy-manno-octulosonate cytidylyltransferase [Flammeovirga]NLR89982.1 3-deoxy-manno-octulosonate cytidylyltransferase [Flammeovirga agarivorans]
MRKFLGLIPARYGSSRLEGKPLADICGKPMIQHVYERAKAALDDVYIATDDKRIVEAVESFGGKVIMTSADHENGTTRCLEALELVNKQTDGQFDAVVNIQGDEPLLEPSTLTELVNSFDEETNFATLVTPVVHAEDLENESEVFVTFDHNKNALYFSRAVIPTVRGKKRKDWMQYTTFYKHLGLYAYTNDALKKFSSLAPTTLEKLESLEQLRWIEHGYQIKVGITEHDSIPVDTKEDLERVRNIMQELV